jgi:hypothetical protein
MGEAVMGVQVFTWLGILFCVSQSAMFSGLNLAFFSIGRLRLEIAATAGSKAAARVLTLRKDSNFLLTTILWGNVGINVLLTLLSNSMLAGLSAFFFSTIVITLIGEILPQAYFSRNALRMASRLMPLFRIYQILLYPIAKPVALLLDGWLGKESIPYFREQDIKELIRRHVVADEADIASVEGTGAINFLDFDDLPVAREGVPVDPKSILKVEIQDGLPLLPEMGRDISDPWIRKIQGSKRKWVVLTDDNDFPRFVLDADGFIRDALFGKGAFNPRQFYHRPIVVTDDHETLGNAIRRFLVVPEHPEDDVVDHDIIIVWGNHRRIITGSDVLGRLLRGITKVAVPAQAKALA